MLYFQYVKILIKSQMQYKATTWMLMFGQFMLAFTSYLSIVLLFDRFDNILGWSFSEVALCFGVASVGMAVAECFFSGFDVFFRLIQGGGFDRLLIRPRGTIVQVMGSDIGLLRLGRIVQGVVVLAIAINMQQQWTIAKSVVLGLMLLCSTVIFTGILILGATLCFWTVKGLEIINILLYGGKEVASYPIVVFGKWMIRFFTFVVPMSCFNYLPLLYVTGRSDNFAVAAYPVLGCLFIIPCILIWRFGVSRYVSTGS